MALDMRGLEQKGADLLIGCYGEHAVYASELGRVGGLVQLQLAHLLGIAVVPEGNAVLGAKDKNVGVVRTPIQTEDALTVIELDYRGLRLPEIPNLRFGLVGVAHADLGGHLGVPDKTHAHLLLR